MDIVQRPRVLILGHSFISRLANDIFVKPYLDSNFDLMQCDIHCYGIGGASVKTFFDKQEVCAEIVNFKPHIIILQVGGNDLCFEDLKPETLACQIIDSMEELHSKYEIKQIFVCELFIRSNPRNISYGVYEHKRKIVNQMLKDMLSDKPYLNFWKHLRLMNSPLHILSGDGVHLNDIGSKKFYRSLRLAVLHALDLV